MTAKQVSDETILNVFRLSNRPFMKTSDVVEEVDIKRRAVQKRLKRLRQESRLVYEEVGQAHVWWLAESEPDQPMGDSGVQLLRWSVIFRKAAGFAKVVTQTGGGFAAFVMIFYLFIAEAPSSALPLISKTQIVKTAFVASIAWAIAALTWGVCTSLSYVLPELAAEA